MKKKSIVVSSIIVILLVFTNNYIGIVKVNGNSMNPTFHEGKILLSNKVTDDFKRFDIIIFKRNGTAYIKRIIGLPNESLEYRDNVLIIDGQEVSENFTQGTTSDYVLKGGSNTRIPSNCYFVLGDNRENSLDSRGLGFVRKEEIFGKIF